MTQILKGLSFLHKNNIIHTDINTDNILMKKPMAGVHSNNIQVLISDLGTSFLADKPTDDGNGTKEYLSPEQRLDIPLTVQTDIWSLGCVFYELVTNSLLFDFDEDDSSSEESLDECSVEGGEMESEDDSETDYVVEWDETYKHFMMMEGILGPAPKRLLRLEDDSLINTAN